MKILGKILWWDHKDQNGIIVDAAGNEYYFDISVLENRKAPSLKRGTVVQFDVNTTIKNLSCAKSVLIPPARSANKFEREFQRSSQLAFQF